MDSINMSIFIKSIMDLMKGEHTFLTVKTESRILFTDLTPLLCEELKILYIYFNIFL